MTQPAPAGTRLLCLYDLDTRLLERPAGAPVGGAFDFGRFRRHLDSAAATLPVVLVDEVLDGPLLTCAGERPSWGSRPRVLVTMTPRGDLNAVLELMLPAGAGVPEVIAAVAASCFGRDELSYDGRPLTGWLAQRLGRSGPLAFGRNVHQCVFPDDRLLDEIVASAARDSLTEAAYRILSRGETGEGNRAGLPVSHVVSQDGRRLAAVSRGVSLVAGWPDEVDNVLALTALTTVSALSVLQRLRNTAFAALQAGRTDGATGRTHARTAITQLADQVGEAQLDLAFGVEAYADGTLIPEAALSRYQAALRGATDLELSMANTSQMVRRLSAVISARSVALEAEAQERLERRDRVLNGVLAAVTLIGLPAGLLLAFFGANSSDVDAGRSILDVRYYWAAYLAAWLPVTTLVAAWLWYARRNRSSPPGQPADAA